MTSRRTNVKEQNKRSATRVTELIAESTRDLGRDDLREEREERREIDDRDESTRHRSKRKHRTPEERDRDARKARETSPVRRISRKETARSSPRTHAKDTEPYAPQSARTSQRSQQSIDPSPQNKLNRSATQRTGEFSASAVKGKAKEPPREGDRRQTLGPLPTQDESDYESYNGSSASKMELSRQVTYLTEKNHALQDVIDGLHKEIKRLDSENIAQKHQLADLKAKLEEVKEEHVDYALQIRQQLEVAIEDQQDCARRERSCAKRHEKEVQDLKRENDSLKQQIRRLRADQDSNKHAGLMSKINSLETRIKDLKEDHEISENRLTRTIKELQSSNQTLGITCRHYLSEAQKLDSYFEQMQRQGIGGLPNQGIPSPPPLFPNPPNQGIPIPPPLFPNPPNMPPSFHHPNNSTQTERGGYGFREEAPGERRPDASSSRGASEGSWPGDGTAAKFPHNASYYADLNVSKTAIVAEIKASYRKLVLKWHPDKPTGDRARYEKIQEAYEALSDAKIRKEYDKFCEQRAEDLGRVRSVGRAW